MYAIDGWVEALLFAADRPLNLNEIRNFLLDAGLETKPRKLKVSLERLEEHYLDDSRGVYLAQIAGGWQFRTKSKYGFLLQKLFAQRPPRMTRASLECLATIAYKQPIIRSQVDIIRGVDSGGVIRGLLHRNLLRVVGRLEAPGRPYLYATSPDFLTFFGLKDLSELPSVSVLPKPPESEEGETEVAKYESDKENVHTTQPSTIVSLHAQEKSSN